MSANGVGRSSAWRIRPTLFLSMNFVLAPRTRFDGNVTPGSGRKTWELPFLTLTLAAISIVLHLLPAAAAANFQFERRALAAGEWWRIVTGHLTHFDSNHLAWDVGALLVLGILCETSSRRRTVVALGLASVAISAAVWIFQPQFECYRGLSGLDSALFALFASSLIEQRRRAPVLLGVVALAGVLAKCVFEIVTETPAFASGNGYAPVPLAHLVGVLGGGIAALIRADLPAPAERSPIGGCERQRVE